jgi:uncharacterized protein YebE (UPF0316 family)
MIVVEGCYLMFDFTIIIELFLIFFSRIIEVSIGTLRVILISKGYRRQGVILAFFEVALWVLVASRVIVGINEQPLKAVVYCLGFALGVYVGSKLENHLAFGRILIQIITSVDKSKQLNDYLREQGFGVTSIDVQGKDDFKKVLMVYTNRKGQSDIFSKTKSIDEHAMIVSTDVASLQGGYINSYNRFVK